MLDVRITLDRSRGAGTHAFATGADITGVFGRSGAGKSTLLHAIAGLVDPATGTIRLRDEVLLDRGAGVNLPVHRRRIGLVFQDDRLFPHLTVARNLAYGARAASPGADADRIIDLLDLDRLRPRRVRHLSGGERQRVALGRALFSAPRLLLLDEPLSSLDREHKQRILGLIRDVNRELGVPMLYVSHDLTELLQVTDRLIVVEGGRTVAHGPLRTLARDAAAWRTLRGLGTTNVLPFTVQAHERDAGLTLLALDRTTSGHESAEPVHLRGPLLDREPGVVVHAAVRPEDIALAERRLDGVSIRNQVPGRVVGVTAHDDRAVAEIDIGRVLLVEISHRTVREMEIEPGRAIWCLIKSNALQYLD